MSYRPTVLACYGGNFVQACVVNLPPLLFIPLREAFGFTYAQLGLLVLINFLTQVSVDLAFSRAVDRYGYRPFVVGGHFTAFLGLALFAASPYLAARPYALMVLATVLFSSGGGIMELLLSPIVNAIPTDDKVRAMSTLHSFYAWGQATVVTLSTGALFALGTAAWPFVMLAWAALPLANAFFFMQVPIAHAAAGHHGEGMRATVRNRVFFACLVVIAMGGASELAISQWSSALMERALGLPKVLGDTIGMAGFAVMLGLGRAAHAKYGSRLKLTRLLAMGAALAIACYLTVSLTDSGVLSLIACALSGIAVSMLWPGALLIAAHQFPGAGTWLFAFMAAAGDIGGSVGPQLVGLLADAAPGWAFLSDLAASLGPENLGLRAGTLVGTLFPVIALIALIRLDRRDGAPPTGASLPDPVLRPPAGEGSGDPYPPYAG